MIKQEAPGFGERLKYARHRKGLTQEELASRLEVGRITVWHWERESKQPRLAHVRALAVALEVTIPWLLYAEAEGD